MEFVVDRAAALDVHKAQVTVWVRVPDGHGGREDLRARYPTLTEDLFTLGDWLVQLGVTHVAMESSGVYWKPVYYVLEDDFALLLVKCPAGQEPAGSQDGHDGRRVALSAVGVRFVAR
jgi:transposase